VKDDAGAARIIRSHNQQMHRRDAFDPESRRLMHRTQIKGGKPFFDPKTLDLRA
jgi:hypothetical protein